MKSPLVLVIPLLMVSNLYAADLGIIFGQNTRLIMSSNQNAIGIRVGNYNSTNYLVHAKVVEADHQNLTSDNFIISPELSEIKPDTSTVLNVKRIGGKYPSDRESLVYVVGRFIPKSLTNQVTSRIELSLTFKMKMFLRPEGLTGGDAIEKSVNRLDYKYEKDNLKITNTSPYHLTFYKFVINDKEIELPDNVKMLAPFESTSLKCKFKPKAITWSLIGDSGFETAQVTRNITN